MNTRTSIFTCTLICATACVAQSLVGTSATGVISGTVTGSDGTKITSGFVGVSGTPVIQSRLTRSSAIAPIASDGSFRLPEIALGTYRICVQAAAAWINPCEWGLDEPTVVLTLAQSSAAINVTLKKGALVPIHVNDPGQLISAHEGKTPGAQLILCVSTDALYSRNASFVSQDASGRNYQLLVPFDRRLSLSVTAGLFRIADATGRALPASGNFIPILAPSGQQTAPVVLAVTGLSMP